MFEERIAKGVKILDKHFPDWEWRVNLLNLDMSSCVKCVIGQVTGGDYLKWMATKTFLGREVGFSPGIVEGPPEEWVAACAPLTKEWKKTILILRAERTNEVQHV